MTDALHDSALTVLRQFQPPTPQQERLRERYVDHLRSEPGGVLRVGADDSRILDLNAKAADILGRRLGTARGLDLAACFVSPERWRDLLTRLKSHGAVDHFEAELTDGAGAGHDCELSGTMLPDEMGIELTILDITPRKREQDERNRLLSAMAQTADSVMVTDTQGNIRHVNQAFEAITGYRSDEVIGLNPRFLKSGEQPPEFYREMWGIIGQGGTFRGRIHNRRKDGTRFVFDGSIAAAHDESGKLLGYVAVGHDATHELKHQERLQQAQHMETLGQLAGGVAHDFNNLLSVILATAELLLDDLPPGEFRGDVDQIHQAANRAAVLTRQLLAFSRRQLLQPEEVDINRVVRGVAPMISRVVGDDIKLDFKLADALWQVQADPGRLEQSLVNLVINARDAMPDGGRIEVTTANCRVDDSQLSPYDILQPGPCVMLQVADTGVGMDARVRAHAFEPFFTTKSAHQGTGLGLAMVHGMIEQSGGQIRIDSEVGKGTTFTILLPATEVDGADEVIAIAKPGPTGRGQRILIVDDDPSIRSIAARVLRDEGYSVTVAEGPGEALVLVESEGPFDLLLTDVVMPSMNGRELAERLSAGSPGMRVLYMSGYADERVLHRGVDASGPAFLGKPFNAVELRRKVLQLFE